MADTVDVTSSVRVLKIVSTDVTTDAEDELTDCLKVFRWRFQTALKKLTKGFCPWLWPRQLATRIKARINFILRWRSQ